MTKEALETLISHLEVGALVFGAIVVIGVAGETVFGIRVWWNNRKLQEIQRSENAELQLKVSQANDRAIEASKGNVDLQYKLATATAELRLNEAKLATEQRKTAEAQKAAAEAQLALQRTVNPRWRNLIIDGQKLSDSLKGNATSNFEILYVHDESSEPFLFAGQLSGLLTSCGWTQMAMRPLRESDALPWFNNQNLPLATNSGVLFEVGWSLSINVKSVPYPTFGHEKDCAACALWTALGGGVISQDPRMPEGLVRIIIGKKP